jgi:hypothetical protein
MSTGSSLLTSILDMRHCWPPILCLGIVPIMQSLRLLGGSSINALGIALPWIRLIAREPHTAEKDSLIA